MNIQHFKAAREVAFTQPPGTQRRAGNDKGTEVYNFTGIKGHNGQTWVRADTLDDLDNNYDEMLDGKPAIRVYNDVLPCEVCGKSTRMKLIETEECDPVCSEECRETYIGRKELNALEDRLKQDAKMRSKQQWNRNI